MTEREKAQCLDMIQELRKAEGDSVTIHYENPDFDEGPDTIVEFVTDWERRYEVRGEGLFGTLHQAVVLRRQLEAEAT